MKKVMITSAAVALAFGLSPFASAQSVDDGSAAAKDHAKAVAKTTNIDDSYNYKEINKKDVDIDVTKKIKNEKTIWDGKAKNDYSPFGAAANNHSLASTKLDVDVKDSFNQTKILNVTKLDGYVSHNKVAHVGNYGGDAYNYSPGGRGGDGYAKAKAYSGDAYGGDGGDAKAKAYGGDAYGGDAKAKAYGGDAYGGKGGYADGGKGGDSNGFNNSGNAAGDDSKYNDAYKNDAHGDWKAGDGGKAKGGKGGFAKGGDALAKAKGGYAEGGDAKAKANGGDGGYAESGYADARADGKGGNGARGGDAYGGDAGTFNASNSISGLSDAAGVTVAIQNTGIAALQQVGVTTMAHINVN